MSDNRFGEQPKNPYTPPVTPGQAQPTPAGPTTKPVSATVFGILNILFGVLGVCGIGFSVAVFFMPQNPQFPNPALEAMQGDGPYSLFLKVAIGIGSIFVVVLILSGVGLLKGRMWGRTLAIVYSVYAIISAVVGGVVNYFLLWGPMLQDAGPAAPGPENAAAIGGAIGGIGGTCVGMIFPIVLLIFMLRPKFKSALEAIP